MSAIALAASRHREIRILFLASFVAASSVTVGAAAPGAKPDFNGTYVLSQGTTRVTLTLSQDGDGQIKGSLSSTTGMNFEVAGMLQDGVAVGACGDGQQGVFFEARLEGQQILLDLIEPGEDGSPNAGQSKRLVLAREGAAKSDAEAARRPTGAPRQAPAPAAGNRNREVEQAMAGLWYYFGGSTERKLLLCKSGRYGFASESSYSGTFREGGAQTGAWGAAGQGGEAGTWTASGDFTSGQVVLTSDSGQRTVVSYYYAGKPNDMQFNGVTYSRDGLGNCE